MRGAKHIITALCGLLLVACASRGEAALELTEIYAPRFAKGFSVTTDGVDTLIVISNPFQGQSEATDYIRIDRPMRRIVCTSSSHVAYLDKLGECNRVVGVSGERFITTPNIDRSKVCDVGYDTALDYERIVMLNPDIVLLYGVTGSNKTICSKLTELNIPYAYVGEHVEIAPLAKSEWLVAFGFLCGKSDEAIALFEELAMRYEELVRLAAECEERPSVMLNAPYQDVWYVPSDDNYMVSLIVDAAGEYVCAGDSSHTSRPIDIETAYFKVVEADFWLNTNQFASLGELQSALPRFGDVEAVQQARVYNNIRRTNPAGGSDFWESGVVDADVVLSDMIEILHPELLDHQLYYYIQLQ